MNDENVYAPSVRNPSHDIVIHNNSGAHMLSIDPNVAHAFGFFEYTVSEVDRKVQVAGTSYIYPKMAMKQLYEDWDALYNELQRWIAAMQEYVPRTFIDLQIAFSRLGRPIKTTEKHFYWMFWTFNQCV
ncbi:hypothetical protein GOBAR_DD20406 [Gossypium barbadense]|nr:hypothetical protein GOBAR_DD20406 [Gossypium barbadense]